MTLRVLDNGRGMPVALSGGNGIRNLTERAAKLGGTCRVSSRPDGGTVLEWQVPAPWVSQEQSTKRMSSSGSTRSAQLTIICSAEPASVCATIRSTVAARTGSSTFDRTWRRSPSASSRVNN